MCVCVYMRAHILYVQTHTYLHVVQIFEGLRDLWHKHELHTYMYEILVLLFHLKFMGLSLFVSFYRILSRNKPSMLNTPSLEFRIR